MKWNNYLFKEGNLSGFTKDMGEHFIRYYTDKALTNLGLNKIFNEKESDIITWYERYRNINLQNSALQEVSNTAYQKGVTKNDLSKFDQFREKVEDATNFIINKIKFKKS
jgi:ribonucleotide reductase beta subunit family protein with ferritin-like domain